MKNDNIIVTKSFSFALKIISICNYLQDEKKQYVLSKQLLRSGTSIGANVMEAINGISKNDFRYKMSISLKEANETLYWLKLIGYSNIIQINDLEYLINESEEICRILGCIVKNSRE